MNSYIVDIIIITITTHHHTIITSTARFYPTRAGTICFPRLGLADPRQLVSRLGLADPHALAPRWAPPKSVDTGLLRLMVISGFGPQTSFYILFILF
jgi:hypothetical protein